MAFYDKFILGQIDARLMDLEASANNRPSFGPGSLSGKLLRPKSIISQLIDVDTLSSVNANTGNLSISGTLTIGSGGKIIDADGSYWDSSGIVLVSAGNYGDSIVWKVSGTNAGSIVADGDGITVGSGTAMNSNYNLVLAREAYAKIGLGWTTGINTLADPGLYLDATTGTATLSGDAPGRIVVGSDYLQASGYIYPGTGAAVQSTGYFDWNTAPAVDRVRVVGAPLEVPSLWFETTSASATYITFQDGTSAPKVTIAVDGVFATNGTSFVVTSNHADAGRASYLNLSNENFGLRGSFNASDFADCITDVREDSQSIAIKAVNNTNGSTEVSVVADDTSTSSSISFKWNGYPIISLNGIPTTTGPGAVVGKIPILINGGATQYYLTYSAA